MCPARKKVEDGRTTYYWIPSADLPLFAPLRLAGVPEPVIDVFEPFFKVLVEAGYDRTVPFDKPTPLQLIPTIDPITLGIQLVSATLEGANNAAKIAGASLPGYAPVRAQLDAAEATAAAGGAPYSDAVRAVNNSFNPITAFTAVEAPIATQINHVTNAVGIPTIANQIIDAALFPAQRGLRSTTCLAPAEDSDSRTRSADLARQFLKRLTPPHDADDTASSARVASLSVGEAVRRRQGQHGRSRRPGAPKPRKRNSEDNCINVDSHGLDHQAEPVSGPPSKKPTTKKAASNDTLPAIRTHRRAVTPTPHNAASVRKLACERGESPADTHARGNGGVVTGSTRFRGSLRILRHWPYEYD